ncbi:hypothetical protein [Cellulomonas soli]
MGPDTPAGTRSARRRTAGVVRCCCSGGRRGARVGVARCAGGGVRRPDGGAHHGTRGGRARPRWGAEPSFAGAEAHPEPSGRARTWDEDDLDEPVRKHHPYTWLHLTVLAVVAFVLGFLIMLLANKGTQGTASGVEPFTTPSSTTATAVTTTLAAGPGDQAVASSL